MGAKKARRARRVRALDEAEGQIALVLRHAGATQFVSAQLASQIMTALRESLGFGLPPLPQADVVAMYDKDRRKKR
jgi:hypothetical protein